MNVSSIPNKYFHKLQRKDAQQKASLVKVEEHGSVVRRGMLLLIFVQMSLIFPRIAIRFCRQKYGKIMDAFLARRFTSNEITE